ncbi:MULTISPECIES: baseplate hub protein [unclassified Providencia]|uniref:baseplate hub protein n=1 Tax=unclassified Providencia TaxID=2633465 RepID=UPI0013E0B71C|nr:hypothetical protein FVA69_14280 [Providencia sp. 1701011]QIF62565.1 hypothetical protein FVA70_14300 [Providencia sp. 1701091]
MAFNRKRIKLTLKLNGKDEVFTSDNQNKLSDVGLRISADVTFGYGSPAPYARIRVYGLPQETMNKLITAKWQNVKALRTLITIEAAEGDFAQVFSGGIFMALPEYSEAPNVSIVIEAISAVFESKLPTPAESYEGSHSVSEIISGICKRIGFSFESNNVNAMVDNPYLTGSDLEKIRWLCVNNDLDLYLGNNSVAIAPKGVPRNIKIAVISPDTGLIGYPVITNIGATFKCLYDPSIQFGALVRVKGSEIELCNGDWRVYGMRAQLETEMDSGRWFMEIVGSNLKDKNVHVAK